MFRQAPTKQPPIATPALIWGRPLRSDCNELLYALDSHPFNIMMQIEWIHRGLIQYDAYKDIE